MFDHQCRKDKNSPQCTDSKWTLGWRLRDSYRVYTASMLMHLLYYKYQQDMQLEALPQKLLKRLAYNRNQQGK